MKHWIQPGSVVCVHYEQNDTRKQDIKDSTSATAALMAHIGLVPFLETPTFQLLAMFPWQFSQNNSSISKLSFFPAKYNWDVLVSPLNVWSSSAVSLIKCHPIRESTLTLSIFHYDEKMTLHLLLHPIILHHLYLKWNGHVTPYVTFADMWMQQKCFNYTL